MRLDPARGGSSKRDSRNYIFNQSVHVVLYQERRGVRSGNAIESGWRLVIPAPRARSISESHFQTKLSNDEREKGTRNGGERQPEGERTCQTNTTDSKCRTEAK